MKLHSDLLIRQEIIDAAEHASAATDSGTVTVSTVDPSGSRSRARALTVLLQGDGSTSRRRNHGNTGFAATYDQWGHFLAFLYAIDPRLVAGPYTSRQDFETKTHGAFTYTLTGV
jgi:hypothetical protein